MLLFVFSLVGFASAIVTRSIDPMVSAIGREFLVPAATAALLSSAFTMPYALGQPILGPLGDILGKTTVLKVCAWCLAACLATSALMPSFPALLALRPVTGFFAGGLMPVAMAILGDRYARADRQLAIARFLTVALIGQVAGASGAGLLIAFVGWRGVMWVSAAMAVVAATGALIIFPQSATAPRKPFAFADIVAGYKAVFANPNAWVCFGIVWAEGISIFGVTPFFAEMLESAHQGGAREAGFIIAGVGVGGVVFSLTVGLMLRFLSRRAMMITGGVIGALGLAAIALDLSWAHDVAYFSCVGFGFFMLHNSVQTEVADLAASARGTAYSMHAFFFFMGQAFGPLLFGPLHLWMGPLWTLMAMACLLLAAALLGGALMRRRMISGILGS